jgi:hypothetical protein
LVNIRKVQRNARRFPLMDDESWFFYYTPRQTLRMPPDVETPEVVRRLINTPKLMITIFWNVSGIHVIDYVPSGESFNSANLIERNLPTIAGLPARHAAVRQKKAFVLHIDNSPIHKSKAVMETMASIPVQLAHIRHTHRILLHLISSYSDS